VGVEVEGVPCEGVILNAIKVRGVDNLWGVEVDGVPCGEVIANVKTDRGVDDLRKGRGSAL
jgi:hypothetical protein